MSEPHISQDELDRIFAREIAPGLDDLISMRPKSAEPRITWLAGQPGSGKTHGAERILAERPDHIPVQGDELRVYHPDYDMLMDIDPLKMPEVTAPATGYWISKSLEHLRQAGASVLVEGTFRTADPVIATARTFLEAGYSTHAIILGVPRAISMMGTVNRYIEQLQTQGSGRWTERAIHDEAYLNLPTTLAGLMDRGLFTTTAVFGRDLSQMRVYPLCATAGEALSRLDDLRQTSKISRATAELFIDKLADAQTHLLAGETPNDDFSMTVLHATGYVPHIAPLAGTSARRIDHIHRNDTLLKRRLGLATDPQDPPPTDGQPAPITPSPKPPRPDSNLAKLRPLAGPQAPGPKDENLRTRGVDAPGRSPKP